MTAATRDVPVELRQQLVPQQAAGGQVSEEGGATERSFDAAAIKARIAEGFETQREVLAPAAQAGDPAAKGRLAGLAQAQRAAEATVDKVAVAFKEAFSEAIRDIYRITLLIALLALLVTLALPELPLRKTNGPQPPVLE
jgi:hypothetical protein